MPKHSGMLDLHRFSLLDVCIFVFFSFLLLKVLGNTDWPRYLSSCVGWLHILFAWLILWRIFAKVSCFFFFLILFFFISQIRALLFLFHCFCLFFPCDNCKDNSTEFYLRYKAFGFLATHLGRSLQLFALQMSWGQDWFTNEDLDLCVKLTQNSVEKPL